MMRKALSKLCRGEEYINTFNVIHDKLTARIILSVGKARNMYTKIWKQKGLSMLTTVTYCSSLILATAIRQEKESKSIHMGKRIFADDMNIIIGELDSSERLFELTGVVKCV